MGDVRRVGARPAREADEVDVVGVAAVVVGVVAFPSPRSLFRSNSSPEAADGD